MQYVIYWHLYCILILPCYIGGIGLWTPYYSRTLVSPRHYLKLPTIQLDRGLTNNSLFKVLNICRRETAKMQWCYKQVTQAGLGPLAGGRAWSSLSCEAIWSTLPNFLCLTGEQVMFVLGDRTSYQCLWSFQGEWNLTGLNSGQVKPMTLKCIFVTS